MHQNRHLQLHQLQREKRKEDGEVLDMLERLSSEVEKRQNGKSGWEQFTDSIEDAWDKINPFKNEAGTTIVKTITSTRDTEVKTTQTPAKATTQAPATTTPPTSTSQLIKAPSTSSSKPSGSSSVGLPAMVMPTSASTISDTTLAVATNTPTIGAQQSSVPSSTSASASQQSATSESSNSGSDAASKAGIAFGVIGGVLVAFLIVWFVLRKRKQQMQQQRLDDDEKLNGSFAGMGPSPIPPPAPPKAPRLSLRPVSRLLPDGLKRMSRGGAVAMANGAPAVYPKNSPSAWERPATGSSTHPANPFGHHAERIQEELFAVSPVSTSGPTMGPSASSGSIATPVSPVGDIGSTGLDGTPTSGVMDEAAIAGAGAAAGVAAGAVAVGALTRKASMRKDGPKHLDLTVGPPPLGPMPPSPAGTEYSMHSVAPGQSPGLSTSAAAIAAAGGPSSSAVHRVQLDFKPTMDDELELKAGSLVRLLFEYDDGWALCIRLDRSQQGVVPRTCLSTRPVKPRPAGPGHRAGPPVNPNRGHQGPQQHPSQRSMAPQGGHAYGPGQRSHPPHGGRPASPAGGRPNSPSGMSRSGSPPGPSQMNQQFAAGPGPARAPSSGTIGRKPVPGQAY